MALVLLSAACVVVGILLFVRRWPAFLVHLCSAHTRECFAVGAGFLTVALVGPVCLVWSAAWLRSSGRRSFYYDSLLEQMIAGQWMCVCGVAAACGSGCSRVCVRALFCFELPAVPCAWNG